MRILSRFTHRSLAARPSTLRARAASLSLAGTPRV